MRRLPLFTIGIGLTATLPATAQTLIGTVSVGNNATYVAPNPSIAP
jgi:hypothetical protein